MEFQDDTATFDIGTQFMFGSNMMVAPKLGLPEQMGPALNGLYNLTVYLPPAADWYFYDSKQFINGSSTPQNMLLGDANYGTFVKAGSILPILNYELGRMSLLSAIDDNLRIEVYPTAAGSASGELYLDDGLSHDYIAPPRGLIAAAPATKGGAINAIAVSTWPLFTAWPLVVAVGTVTEPVNVGSVNRTAFVARFVSPAEVSTIASSSAGSTAASAGRSEIF